MCRCAGLTDDTGESLLLTTLEDSVLLRHFLVSAGWQHSRGEVPSRESQQLMTHFPKVVFAPAAVLVLMALSTTYFTCTEPPPQHIRKGKVPTTAAAPCCCPVLLIPEQECECSQTVKHIGDSAHKSSLSSNTPPNNVSVGPSECEYHVVLLHWSGSERQIHLDPWLTQTSWYR